MADSRLTTSLPSVTATVTPSAAPTKATLSLEKLGARLARVDRVLVVLVVVAAFLLASFPATNGDLLQHFAVGRLVVEGKYQFGVDPFTFTTEGVYWVNHSWLFDLTAYGLYSIPTIGGAILVLFKGILIALLAVVMLRTSWRPGERMWIPATVTALAVLALSPQLFLRPAIVSFLFLGLTLWFLIRPAPQKRAAREVAERKKKARSAGKPIAVTAYWPLPVLCLLWVNLDQWFLLGPITIALYLFGVLLQDRLMPLAANADDLVEDPKTLAWVLLACLCACVINPHHFRAFVLPPQLGFDAAVEKLREDPLFYNMFLTPLSTSGNSHLSYFTEPNGLNIAGLAYFPLLLLGLLSFVLSVGIWRFWRVALWLFFAGLSLSHARAIPFFAIVAAPIAALNLLDYAARQFGGRYLEGPSARSWARSGRVLTMFLLLLFVVAVVPGWTQAKPRRARHVGWGVAFDPTLEQAARQVAAWRKDGKLPAEAHWFNTTPDLVNYFAWFCPGEKGFLDQRLSIFANVAEDYVKARKALLTPEDPAQPRPDLTAATEVFDKYQVNLVGCFEADMRGARMVDRLLPFPDRFLRIYGQGRVVLCGRGVGGKDRADNALRALVVDDDRRAFGPNAVPAPDHRPEREPRPREWFEELWKQPPPLYNPDAEDAWLNYRIFLSQVPRWQTDNFVRLESALTAGMVGLAAPGSPNVMEAAIVAQLLIPKSKPGERAKPTPWTESANNLHQSYLSSPGLLDHGPPAPLYLALRAARRAIARNPDDANAYLLLGQIYSDLQNRTREGGYAPNELREIRLAQAVGALQQAVSLDPELAEAHNLLADQYRRLGYLDLTARHMREHLRCVQNAPPPAGLSAEDRAKALQQREDQIQSLEAVVKRREDDLLAKHNKLPAADKAALALRSDRDAGGLAITALDALKTIDFKELAEKDPAAARRAAFMQIDVLFLMGQLSDIREVVKGDETFDWYRIRLAAATGDYAEADEILEKLSKRAATLELDRGLVAGRLADLVARTATRATNMAGPLPALFDLAEMQARLQRASGPQMQIDIVAGLVEAYNRFPNQGLWFLAFRDMARESIVPVQQEVDLRVLRGWLALEAGDNKKALEELQTALSLRWQPRHFLPVLATLGAASPFEVMTSMFGGGSAVVPPLFDFNGRGLAVIGLQRLQAKKE